MILFYSVAFILVFPIILKALDEAVTSRVRRPITYKSINIEPGQGRNQNGAITTEPRSKKEQEKCKAKKKRKKGTLNKI